MRTVKTMPLVDNIKPTTNGHHVEEPASEDLTKKVDAVYDNPAKVVEPVTETEPHEHDMAEEIQLLDVIYKVTVKSINLAREERQLVKQLDGLREELESAKSLKMSLINELPETLLKLRDGLIVDLETETAPSASGGNDPASDVPDSSWKAIDTRTICDGIPRFGVGKITALCDSFPTLGDLAACREQSVRDRVHFSELLPTGIGVGIADHLTERLMAAETGGGMTAEEQAAKEREPVDEDTDPNKWVKLFASEVVDKKDYEPRMSDKEAWNAGHEAYDNNLKIDSFDEEQGATYRMDFVRGWLNARKFEAETIAEQKLEDDSQYEDVEDDEAESRTERLERMVKNIKKYGETARTKDDEVYDDGYECGLDEQPIDACPPVLSPEDQHEWLRGWIEGSSFGIDL